MGRCQVGGWVEEEFEAMPGKKPVRVWAGMQAGGWASMHAAGSRVGHS